VPYTTCSIDSNRRLQSIVAALIFAGALSSGCQKHQAYDRVSVSGRVLVDGAPLKAGYIRFIPFAGGRPAVANVDGDGRFDFGKEGVVVGRNRVEVVASEQVGATGYRWHAPAKYASYTTSGLEQEIAQPTSDLTFNLNGDGVKPPAVQGGADDSDPKNLKARQ
jgi:hypothetical protein